MYVNPCPQCGAKNGSGCKHGIGGNEGLTNQSES